MEWKGVSSQISPNFSAWKLSSLTLSHMAKSRICIFRQPRMHDFFKLLPHRIWHLITIIERKEIYGVSRQSKIPYISNQFSKFGHKGELSAVFSAIYYLKHINFIHYIALSMGHHCKEGRISRSTGTMTLAYGLYLFGEICTSHIATQIGGKWALILHIISLLAPLFIPTLHTYTSFWDASFPLPTNLDT